MSQSDDNGDDSDFDVPKTKPPKSKPKQSTKAVSSTDANKKETFMGEVLSVYTDQKKSLNGANGGRGFMGGGVILNSHSKGEYFHFDFDLSISDIHWIQKQYAKSINA